MFYTCNGLSNNNFHFVHNLTEHYILTSKRGCINNGTLQHFNHQHHNSHLGKQAMTSALKKTCRLAHPSH